MSSSYNDMRPSRTKKVPGRSAQAEQMAFMVNEKLLDSNVSSG